MFPAVVFTGETHFLYFPLPSAARCLRELLRVDRQTGGNLVISILMDYINERYYIYTVAMQRLREGSCVA
jgi:hypothetical protein